MLFSGLVIPSMAELSSMTQIVNGVDSPLDLTDSALPQRFWSEGAILRLSEDQFFMAVGPWKEAPEADSQLGIMDFFASSPKWLKAHQSGVFSQQEARRFFETQLSSKTFKSSDFSEPDRAGFETAFRMIQGKIQRGEIEKAVPIITRKSSSRPQAGDLAHMFMSAMALPTSLHIFGFWDKDGGVFGATPEILFTLEGNRLRSMALAGSCPKQEQDQRMSLLKDPKELREHNLVVEDLHARLKPLGWLRQGQTQILELPTILHLQTEFEVSGCAKAPSELIRQLHPTAALAVSPRHYGYQWLKDLPDQLHRGRFGAPITFNYKPQHSVSLVAIRSLFWNSEGSSVFAGCGLVAASRFEREWDELATKLNSVFRLLGLD